MIEDSNKNTEYDLTNEAELDRLFGDGNSNSYFYYNKEDPGSVFIDVRENAIDSLETALTFFNRNDNLKWKWIVFALHHSLYSFCISALDRGNYETVLFKGYDEDNKIVAWKGNEEEVKKSEIVPFYIKNIKTPAYRINWVEVSKSKPPKVKSKTKNRQKLIGFWTALARVQDDYFWMGRLYGQKALQISDDELEKICWLVEAVRNDITHYIPKGYVIDVPSIIESCKVVVRKIEFLALESYSILYLKHDQDTKRIKETTTEFFKHLKKEQKLIEDSIKRMH